MILKNAGAGWKAPTNLGFTPPLYPRIFLLPNGKVFYTGQGSGNANATGYMFDPSTTSVWSASVPTTMNRSYGTSVLLPLMPPDYRPRVMNLGGGNSGATASTEIIDLSAASPAWNPGPGMSSARVQLNAVLLPDGRSAGRGRLGQQRKPQHAGEDGRLVQSGEQYICVCRHGRPIPGSIILAPYCFPMHGWQ